MRKTSLCGIHLITQSHTRAQILHKLFYNNREHILFMNNKLSYSSVIDFAKYRCKTFSACLYLSNDHQ